ncbi:sce7726 family protein [Afifella sp. IM 167]|uniref:sce7726 family protein n=1 Tax=Afifella sp. IM 167 TaxID=2033586 RepID=UPI001CCEDE61
MNSQPATHPITRDACIRAPLVAWLRSQHPDDGSTELLQELKMPRPSARIDLAMVNGELVGFEIKSDADTLGRLNVQVPAFSRFFDRVSIVTTRKHLRATRTRIPHWWGIILYEGNCGGEFRVKRLAKRNRRVDVRSLLYALSKQEIAEVGRRAGSPIVHSITKDAMVECTIRVISERDICAHVRDVIRCRPSLPRHT